MIRQSSEEVKNLNNQRLEIVLNKDFTTSATGTLIKATHLTLFYILGYQYVNTATSADIGLNILLSCYEKCHNLRGAEKKSKIDEVLGEFSGMLQSIQLSTSSSNNSLMRPVDSNENVSFHGTLYDKKFIGIVGSSGSLFSIGVIIKTISSVYAVLIPIGSADAMATYLNFIKNPPEKINVKLLKFMVDENKNPIVADCE